MYVCFTLLVPILMWFMVVKEPNFLVQHFEWDPICAGIEKVGLDDTNSF